MSWRRGCQWRWKLDYLEGLSTHSYGIHLDFGTSVHEAIELHRTPKNLNALPLQEAKILFEKKFRDLYEKNSQKYKEHEQKMSVDGFVQAGKIILDHLKSCDELEKAHVMFNEYELIVPIERSDDVKLNFKGYVDMIVRTKAKTGKDVIYIIDFKTCSWGWTLDKKNDKLMQYQLFLYKYFFCKKHDLDPKSVRCAFVLLKRKPAPGSPAVEFFPVSAGPVNVQRALDDLSSDITEMSEKVKTGQFEKNRSQCTNLYGEICPYYDTDKCQGKK